MASDNKFYNEEEQAKFCNEKALREFVNKNMSNDMNDYWKKRCAAAEKYIRTLTLHPNTNLMPPKEQRDWVRLVNQEPPEDTNELYINPCCSDEKL